MSPHGGPVADLFRLSPGALQHVREMLNRRIVEGLAAPGREVAALPAWLAEPPSDVEGEALVVDLGGTNMRAARVRLLADGRMRVVRGPVQGRVPGVGQAVDRETFFGAQAALVATLDPPADLPVGYCFSYPAEIMPDGDARLLRWTKDILVPEVEGTAVGAGLREALGRAGIRTSGVRVLNDTVATLLAGARAWLDAETPRVVGLIVGTGTNMATFVPVGLVPKLGDVGWPGGMAVNLESGNFQPPHLNLWDEELDMASGNPGTQRMEKALSGRYLGPLLAAASGDPSLAPPEEGAAALVRLRERDDDVGRLAAAILDRSADLVAAGLAAVVDLFPGDDRVAVAAEGSLFWKTPGYADRVRSRLAGLLGDEGRVRVDAVADANLAGAAAAALAPLGVG